MDPIAQEFAHRVRRALGSHLKQLVLFGSRARGNARPDSDYDVLVVVDERSPALRNLLLDVEVDLLTRDGAHFASLFRSVDEWARTQGYPLARNIGREGVSV